MPHVCDSNDHIPLIYSWHTLLFRLRASYDQCLLFIFTVLFTDQRPFVYVVLFMYQWPVVYVTLGCYIIRYTNNKCLNLGLKKLSTFRKICFGTLDKSPQRPYCVKYYLQFSYIQAEKIQCEDLFNDEIRNSKSRSI